MNYFCEPCDKHFNGIRPYEAHQVSEKHRKKVNIPTQSTAVSSTTQYLDRLQLMATSSSSPETGLDPFIVTENNLQYRCTCCKLDDLNSIEQAQSHASGAKHNKMKIQAGSVNLTPNSPSDQTTDMSEVDIANSKFQFNFHDIKIENVLKDVKVFGANDPIVF